jgi:prepilin-type processing-associated H-X9-DG protein
MQMDENLVGYLLNCLDPDEQAQVEENLGRDPEALKRAERLRSALAPLSADDDEPEPPHGLAVRTIARVAEVHCRKLPPAPPELPVTLELRPRRGWRRIDTLVAAGILLCALTLVPSLSARLWRQYQVYSCANNMRKFHVAMMNFGDTHDGALPKVEEKGPRSFAGVFVPLLHDAGVLDKDIRVTCVNTAESVPLNRTVNDLEELYTQSEDEFRAVSRNIAGCYAYTLGYTQNGTLLGVRRGIDDGRTPVMSDCPPADGSLFTGGNSTNHGSRGQNVLFLDGSVTFASTRFVGLDGDDIFLSRERRMEAGRDRRDSVLGPSGASPMPNGDE